MGSALPWRPGLWPPPLLLGVDGWAAPSQLRGLHLGIPSQRLREVQRALVQSLALTDPECSADRGQGASPLMLSSFVGRYGEGTTQARSPEGPTTALSLGLAPAFPLPRS